MRARWVMGSLILVFLGTVAGTMMAPPPATAVQREIIQLQQQVAQLLQGQQDLRSTVDANNAAMKTLVQQTLDSINQLNTSMGSLQKSVQEVQANSGARTDQLTTQVQGVSDNMQDLQSRVGKLSQQLTDVQSLLQAIDAKVSGSAPTTAATGSSPGIPAAGMPPISSDTLYQNALRDYNSGKYDLARQEFSDYLKNFPANDLASNCQFYLGEIFYAQGDYQRAASAYDKLIVNYPKSYKLAAAHLKKGEAMLALGQKTSATREFREVVRLFPGSDEARRAQVHLRELAPSSGRRQ